MSEQIVETRVCKRTGQKFNIYQSDIDMLERLAPVIGGKKMSFDLPFVSPLARQFHRFAFRNERKLYKRKCDLTDKPIVTLFNPGFKGKVFDQDAWRGDGRNAFDYGLDYEKGKFI